MAIIKKGRRKNPLGFRSPYLSAICGDNILGTLRYEQGLSDPSLKVDDV
jgi:hypothetical protein